MSRVAILVLGMHRSGTSALTWLLGQLGAALPGDGIGATADNAHGYFESAGLVRADDQLLRVARSSWFDPRPLDLSRLSPPALRSRQERIREAIDGGWGAAPLLAIKDPRQCRFVGVMAGVLAGMAIEARAVLMLRPPAAIAASLARRDGTGAAYAHLLWLRHMIDAERDTRGMMRAVVDYDAMLADWRGAVARLAPLAGRVGGVADEGAVAGFLDPALRHFTGSPVALEQPLAGIVALAEAALAALAAGNGAAGDGTAGEAAGEAAGRAGMDDVAARLDAVPWLAGDIVHDELRHRRVGPPDSGNAEGSPFVPGEVEARSTTATAARPSTQLGGAGTRGVGDGSETRPGGADGRPDLVLADIHDGSLPFPGEGRGPGGKAEGTEDGASSRRPPTGPRPAPGHAVSGEGAGLGPSVTSGPSTQPVIGFGEAGARGVGTDGSETRPGGADGRPDRVLADTHDGSSPFPGAGRGPGGKAGGAEDGASSRRPPTGPRPAPGNAVSGEGAGHGPSVTSGPPTSPGNDGGEPAPDFDGEAALIRASGLFDAGWYLGRYPDAAASGLDPVEHYLRVGAGLGHWPNPLFDTGYYARQMARAGVGRADAGPGPGPGAGADRGQGRR